MALNQLTDLQPTNIKVTGIATFDQTVGIAGTLTYQDVTNVDAVGILTARSDINALGNIVGDSATNISGINSVTATTFYGSGANLAGVSNVTINNNANDRIITGSNTADTLNGNANFTYSNQKVSILGSQKELLGLQSTHAEGPQFSLSDGSGAFAYLGSAKSLFTGGSVTDLGLRTANNIVFGINGNEKVRIASDGKVGIGVTNPIFGLQVTGSTGIGMTGTNGAYGYFVPYNGSTGNMEFRLNWPGGSTESIIFYVTGNERMRISPQGYVTKPDNPVFHAFDAGSDIGQNTDIVFGQERFDVGNGYNTSTGEYTAPVTGYYHFYAQVYRQNNSDDSAWGFFLDTGSGYSQITESRMENDRSGDTGRGYATLQCSIYWYMTAGHKIKCRVTNQGNIHCNTAYSYFCGNLVG